MSVDISGFEDVSKERKSKVWINMLFHKQKGLALCKICLEKQFTRIVYAKNGSTKTASDHLKTHGVCENNVVASIPGQKSCKSFSKKMRLYQRLWHVWLYPESPFETFKYS